MFLFFFFKLSLNIVQGEDYSKGLFSDHGPLTLHTLPWSVFCLNWIAVLRYQPDPSEFLKMVDRLMVFSEFQPCLLLCISSDISVGTMEDIEIRVGSVFYDEPFFLNYPYGKCDPSLLYSERRIYLLYRTGPLWFLQKCAARLLWWFVILWHHFWLKNSTVYSLIVLCSGKQFQCNCDDFWIEKVFCNRYS